jgi:DNA-binding transcriptional MocR family regulator
MQHSQTPSYLSLANSLIAGIRAGHYCVDDRLPSVRVLAAAQRVSVSTVTRCYRHLEALGYAVARNKSGIYVADWKALQALRASAAPSAAVASSQLAPVVSPMEYDKLVSLEHRMTQLYSLTDQPLTLALHLANAAPQWYPCEALAKIGQRLLRADARAIGAYPTGTGLPAFKAELVKYMAGFGVDVPPQELLITNGSTEALSVALRAVTQPGDAVAVESPVYFGLLQVMENLGLKVIEIPCAPGAGINLDVLDYALEHQSGIRAIVAMPNFQNPLGCTMRDTNKRRLLATIERHDLALIEDDVFGDLSHAQERPLPVKAWDRHGRVVYYGSCSKSLAPAFRLGWICGGRWHSRIESLKLTSSLVTPLFEQTVLAEFMKSGGLPLHLRTLRERLAATVPLAVEAVRQHFPRGTQVVSPAGGWWLWIALPQQVDTLALLRLAVTHGIAFTPGILFSATGRYSNYMRLNTGRPWGRDLEQGIRTLGQLLAKL